MMQFRLINPLALVLSLLALTGCATNVRPLPVESLTTGEIIQHARHGQSSKHYTISKPLDVPSTRATSTTAQQVADLNRDFKRVPNPEIIGFVYAHRAGEVPIPGYATVFPLYDREHYAVRTEGLVPHRVETTERED